jgi:RpiB/LacA/LacB family sugar-phosphate isomerase
MRISIGGDHADPTLKKVLIEYLESKNIETLNRGTNTDESVDYPDFAHAVAVDVSQGDVDWGILICGSANGVAMTANKHEKIRAGLAWNTEVARLIKQHNNANVLCIPARFVTHKEAIEVLDAFMAEEFEGGRHARRVGKIACMVLATFVWITGIVQAQPGELETVSSPEVYAATIDSTELESHLMVLASDAFEGRETGERGAEKAAAYIASHFESLGIAPYNGETYYQDVPLVRSQIKGGRATVNGTDLVFLEDFLFYPGIRDGQMSNLPMVAIADTSAWPDVNGAVVVIRASTTDGKTNWQKGLNDSRIKASEKGARAVVVVGDGLSTLRSRMKPWLMRKSMTLDRSQDLEGDGTRIPTFLVASSSTSNWWSGSALKSWKKWTKAEKKGKRTESSVLPEATWTFELLRDEERIVSQNVLGYIPGRDSVLTKELVVITAHYDHVGTIDGEIHNGADDDGSGTVTVLELAEAYMTAVNEGNGPRRSVLLMTVVGEEKGLLGSEWYADHPVWPLENTVANLNVDMIGRVDEDHADDNRYVYLIGSDKLSSELHDISEQANTAYTNLALDYTFNAPDDPNRFYYRSDHYNFAKNNIPVIFYFSGVHEDYHRPGDDPEKVMYGKTAEIGRLIFHTSWQLSNQDKRIEVDRVNDFPTK